MDLFIVMFTFNWKMAMSTIVTCIDVCDVSLHYKTRLNKDITSFPVH